MRFALQTTVWISLLVAAVCPVTRADDPADFFEKRVRPVLAANCFFCHGEKNQESNLRLDSRDAILQGGDGGPAAKAGDPSHSTLVQAIRWDGELKMPPEKKLSESEIAILTQWVKQGLAWPQKKDSPDLESWRSHWSFRPLKVVAPPLTTDTTWPRTVIDRFILAELERAGLRPSTEAEARALIRRATFDLLGLPPTPEEVEAFVNDTAPESWERLLSRLLASPQYGERWGRHWLDVARYADTKGYVFFEEKKYPWAYTYRDYVIRAFNSDLPYDRFIVEQIAADQLNLDGDKWPLTALGFLTVGSHFMNNTHDIIDDRIDVVTRGLLGLTVTCARCHDHKYDPVSAADYYSLYGVFRSCMEPTVPPTFDPLPDTEEYRKFAAQMEILEKKLVDFVTSKHSELVADARKRVADYLMEAYKLRDQPPTDDFMLLVDKGDLNPTMILRWQVYLAERKSGFDSIWSAWHAFAQIPSETFASQAEAILQQLSARTGESRSMNRLLKEALHRAPLNSMSDVVQRYAEVLQSADKQWQSKLQKAAESNQPAPANLDDPAVEELRQVLYGERSPPQVPLAMDWGFLSLFPDRPTQGEFEKLLKEMEKWMMTAAGAPPRAMVLLDAKTTFEPQVFLRGNPNRLGPKVPRRFLSALGGDARPFQQGSGRSELAREIVDANNPLTARVIVNRVWAHHFGQGLVRTPSDFGLRSEAPSHPELLDYLASEFMANGWSLKWLHFEIMRSAVYRQTTDSRPASDSESTSSKGAKLDPENRLLWKATRRRLDFESHRDAMLSVAESLDLRLGGPPVELLGDSVVPRRSIYAHIDRMDVPTLLTTFDFPNPLTSSPQRTPTTVAPQALHTMNSSFVAEIARRFAARSDVASLSRSEDRISRMYKLSFSRRPTAEELAEAIQYVGENPDDARWQQFAHALLLANEFVFVD